MTFPQPPHFALVEQFVDPFLVENSRTGDTTAVLDIDPWGNFITTPTKPFVMPHGFELLPMSRASNPEWGNAFKRDPPNPTYFGQIEQPIRQSLQSGQSITIPDHIFKPPVYPQPKAKSCDKPVKPSNPSSPVRASCRGCAQCNKGVTGASFLIVQEMANGKDGVLLFNMSNNVTKVIGGEIDWAKFDSIDKYLLRKLKKYTMGIVEFDSLSPKTACMVISHGLTHVHMCFVMRIDECTPTLIAEKCGGRRADGRPQILSASQIPIKYNIGSPKLKVNSIVEDSDGNARKVDSLTKAILCALSDSIDNGEPFTKIFHL